VSEPASPLKALSVETKALIMVSEFEARRMPMFQMRAVLGAIMRDEAERKTIIDLLEKDLRATGYPDDKIAAFLTDLLSAGPPPAPAAENVGVQSTRRLRSPFALGFESAPGSGEGPPPPDVIAVLPGQARPASSASTPAVESSGALPPPLKPAPIPASNPRRTTVSFMSKTPVSTPAVMSPTPAAGTPVVPIRGPINPPLPAQEPMQPVGQRAIPRHELAFGKVITSPGSTAAPTQAAPRPLVLIADDDKRIRMVFRLRLEEAGFAVLELGDGQEAWERLQKGGIAIAVLDMKMPGLHGLEVLARMVDNQIDIPVIVCSAYDQLENEFVVQTHPRLKYLVKPVPPDTLVAAARALLAAKPNT
jgi:CheY-like chemotaxis protein